MDGRSIIDIKWSEEAGIGCTGMCLYRGDGAHCTMDEKVDEDRVISYRVNDIHLYSIFDGHDGSKASQFAAQQFPLELLLGQLEAPIDEEEIRTVIANAFHMVEEKFFDMLEDEAAASDNAISVFSPRAKNASKTIMTKEKTSADQFAGGTTAVMVIYCHGKLFFANCGDSIAVLCRVSADGVLNVHPISILHNIDSEDEALRLSLLGLNVDDMKHARSLKLTRCIGNYALKKYYQTFPVLRPALTSPIICDPEIIGGIPVHPDMRGFVYLMSSGLYRSWTECTGSESVETDIAQLITTHLSSDKSLHDVSEAVLQEVCNRHAQVYAAGNISHSYFRREEMTLLIRNFGFDDRDVRSPQLSPLVDSTDEHSTLMASSAFARRTPSQPDLLTNGSDNTDVDSLPATFNSSERDASLESVDAYVDFSDLASLDADFVWSDSDE
ncbi:putative TGF-beta-activated kinase 1 and MAP3K7-binding protein 1 [Hypsibius exemplaris]|uniref:TGF-beta-activated kinase 1 and MAP3K7-binding protein 1 n=1 Tax=Hypsibius exemplaris TaxID=2072580 RepID=A0A1W0WCB4_HYPEX|nr:putative TGF-beta-activated kinase 1 and MAP3K7-binding protein 1 [Hypsibius exemplaris]